MSIPSRPAAVRISDDTRERVRSPLGLLIRNEDFTPLKLSRLLMRSSTIVSVGDATTERLVSLGIVPKVSVVDGREMRKPRPPPAAAMGTKLVRAANPPGCISRQATLALARALKSEGATQILIDGEEDLLTLIAILLIPDGGAVLYGQPREGLVIVNVEQGIKKKVGSLLGNLPHEWLGVKSD